jgi:hypothetical protein
VEPHHFDAAPAPAPERKNDATPAQTAAQCLIHGHRIKKCICYTEAAPVPAPERKRMRLRLRLQQ